MEMKAGRITKKEDSVTNRETEGKPGEGQRAGGAAVGETCQQKNR